MGKPLCHWDTTGFYCVPYRERMGQGVRGKVPSVQRSIATNSCSAVSNTVKKQPTTNKGSMQVSWSNSGSASASQGCSTPIFSYRACVCVCVLSSGLDSVGARLTRVHTGEHQAQCCHSPVRRWHVDSVHAEFDQRFTVDAGQLFRQQEALEPTKDAMVNDGRG